METEQLELLKQLLREWIESEKEDLATCEDKNSFYAGMCLGSLEAYKTILGEIHCIESGEDKDND